MACILTKTTNVTEEKPHERGNGLKMTKSFASYQSMAAESAACSRPLLGAA